MGDEMSLVHCVSFHGSFYMLWHFLYNLLLFKCVNAIWVVWWTGSAPPMNTTTKCKQQNMFIYVFLWAIIKHWWVAAISMCVRASVCVRACVCVSCVERDRDREIHTDKLLPGFWRLCRHRILSQNSTPPRRDPLLQPPTAQSESFSFCRRWTTQWHGFHDHFALNQLSDISVMMQQTVA